MKRNALTAFCVLGVTTTVACAGKITLSDAELGRVPTDEAAGSEAIVGENSFQLDLPDITKMERDVIKVRLNGPGGLEYERSFALGKAPVVITKLPAGEYKIVLELMQKGVLKERGKGSVVVEAKKVAQADIVLEAVEQGQGGIEIRIRQPDEGGQPPYDGGPDFKKRARLFSDTAKSIEIRQEHAVPGCGSFYVAYDRAAGVVKYGGCLAGMVLNIPASEKKLSVSQKAIVEKFLVNVMYSPDDEVKNAMACVPQMGAKIRVVKAEELDGKKIVAKVDGPECVNEATGVLHSDEFEDLAREFGAVVKAF